jgi:hypothetical protein
VEAWRAVISPTGLARRLLALAPLLLAAAVGAGPHGEWDVTYQFGFDSEVLADPEHDGVVESMTSSFLTVDNDIELLWPSAGAALAGSVTASGYSGDGPGAEVQGYAEGGLRHAWTAGLFTDVGGSLLVFRRREYFRFDVDRPALSVEAIGRAGAAALLGVRAARAWLSYPGRAVTDAPDARESDRQVDLSGLWVQGLAGGIYLALDGGYRWQTSNDPIVRYQGPWASLRGVAGAQRTYADHPWAREVRYAGVDRVDRTWRVGATAERALSERAVAFGQVVGLRQESRLEELEFDQWRVTAGVRIRLWESDPAPRPIEADLPELPLR